MWLCVLEICNTQSHYPQMALQMSLSSPPLRSSPPPSAASWSSSRGFAPPDPSRRAADGAISRVSLDVGRRGRGAAVKSSLESAGTAVAVGTVTEVNKDTFWPIVKAAGPKVVVLDMYTQWCGPCKVMAPRYLELSQKYLDVVFLKLDCNQENKNLAKELGIRVVPTFKILRDNKVVKEVTGAKFDDLVLAIDTVKSG